jgi:hypothetical protein
LLQQGYVNPRNLVNDLTVFDEQRCGQPSHSDKVLGDIGRDKNHVLVLIGHLFKLRLVGLAWSTPVGVDFKHNEVGRLEHTVKVVQGSYFVHSHILLNGKIL